jgi:fructokinase
VNNVLVVGEALVDIMLRPGSTALERPGGSPANVALGLARLGRNAELLTHVGDDPRGRVVREHLESSGVHLVPGSVARGSTSTATATLDAAGVARYDFNLDWRLPATDNVLASPNPAQCLHTGSLAAVLQPGADDVLALVQKAAGRATVSYDPNARPALMGDPVRARDRVETLARYADLVKVSDEDLAWLAPDEDPVQVAARWLDGGRAVVVVTRGSEGAVGLCRDGDVKVSAGFADVVDTVGAGDSFMAGLLDYLAELDLLGPHRLADLQAIGTGELAGMLQHATRIAAITCARPGADPPTRADLLNEPVDELPHETAGA